VRSIEANVGSTDARSACDGREAEGVLYEHRRDTSRIGPSEIAVNLSGMSVDINVAKLYLRDMQSLPIKSERLAELEQFARRRGKSTADALDDALAEYLEWERQDYQEALEGIRDGLEDVKAGRTTPADEFFDDFARKHGLPR
jgi:predicted transcriptional regulator